MGSQTRQNWFHTCTQPANLGCRENEISGHCMLQDSLRYYIHKLNSCKLWRSAWFTFTRSDVHSLTRYQYHTLMNTWYINNSCHMYIIYFQDETHLIYQKMTQIVLVIQPTFNPGSLNYKNTLYGSKRCSFKSVLCKFIFDRCWVNDTMRKICQQTDGL